MFRFRLDFLLRYRRQLEEAEMYELANKVRGAAQIRNELETARARAGELVDSARQRTSDKVTAPVLALYSNYLHELRKSDLAGQGRLALAEREVETQREALTQASIKRKAIEKLEEFEKKSFIETNLKREHKVLDEMASLKFTRKNDDK
ncbi:MAG: flagellar export protein FliJ [Deltaproteobacteria bacterium]|nr:flagellar export protein FliJ [Deltaproteobacteria bacterium]